MRLRLLVAVTADEALVVDQEVATVVALFAELLEECDPRRTSSSSQSTSTMTGMTNRAHRLMSFGPR